MLSTMKAKYVAVTKATKEMVWLQGIVDELGKTVEKGVLHSDSQSAIFLAKNLAFHSRCEESSRHAC